MQRALAAQTLESASSRTTLIPCIQDGGMQDGGSSWRPLTAAQLQKDSTVFYRLRPVTSQEWRFYPGTAKFFSRLAKTPGCCCLDMSSVPLGCLHPGQGMGVRGYPLQLLPELLVLQGLVVHRQQHVPLPDPCLQPAGLPSTTNDTTSTSGPPSSCCCCWPPLPALPALGCSGTAAAALGSAAATATTSDQRHLLQPHSCCYNLQMTEHAAPLSAV